MTQFFAASVSVIEALESRRLLTITPVGQDVTVAGPASVISQDLAVAGNGSCIVATIENADTPKLTAVRYAADGSQTGNSLALATLASRVTPVSVSMDTQGDAVVAYQSNENEIDAILISKTGTAGSPIAVASVGGNETSVSDPSVSMDSNGDFFVAWIADSTSPHGNVIEVRAFDNTGTPLASKFIASPASNVSSYSDLDIAAIPGGSGAVFVYTDTGDSPAGTTDFGIVSTMALVGQVKSKSSPFIGGEIHPHVAVYADGSFIISAESIRTQEAGGGDPIDFGGFVQHFDATGTAVGNEIELGGKLPGVAEQKHIESIDVATTSDGGFVASFVQTVNGTSTVYVSKYQPDNAEDADGPATIASGFATATEVGADDNGGVVVARLNAAKDATSGEARVQQLQIQSVFVHKRILYILGTNGTDNFDLTFDGTNFALRDNGMPVSLTGLTTPFQLIARGYGGDDTISNETALPATIQGGDGNDTLNGGSQFDSIEGGNGDDTIAGGDGNDRLFGDDGLDSLSGNAGRDSLFGGDGADRLGGNGGRDKLFGGEGDDRLFGGASGDWLFGDGGADQLNGEGGNDRLYGDGFGSDTVSDPGIDTLHGNAGDDQFFTSGDGFNDQLFGDGGADAASADPNDVLTSIESTLT